MTLAFPTRSPVSVAMYQSWPTIQPGPNQTDDVVTALLDAAWERIVKKCNKPIKKATLTEEFDFNGVYCNITPTGGPLVIMPPNLTLLSSVLKLVSVTSVEYSYSPALYGWTASTQYDVSGAKITVWDAPFDRGDIGWVRVVYVCGYDFMLAAPGAPVITHGGTPGSTAYTYKVTAIDANGETEVSTGTATATGAATLNGTNTNIVTWTKVTGATGYKIYRTASSGSPSTTGLVGTVGDVATFTDTGIAATDSPPSTNTTGNLPDDLYEANILLASYYLSGQFFPTSAQAGPTGILPAWFPKEVNEIIKPYTRTR